MSDMAGQESAEGWREGGLTLVGEEDGLRDVLGLDGLGVLHLMRREGAKEAGRQGGREGGKSEQEEERGKKGGRERRREGGRKGGWITYFINVGVGEHEEHGFDIFWRASEPVLEGHDEGARVLGLVRGQVLEDLRERGREGGREAR